MASTAVEAASVKAASSVKSTAAMKPTAYWPVSDEARPATGEAAPKPRPPVESRTTVKAGTSIKAVKPWPSADEESAGKPTRTIVAVRRAGVRGITIVAVGAHRSCRHVSRTDSNSDRKSLCVYEGS